MAVAAYPEISARPSQMEVIRGAIREGDRPAFIMWRHFREDFLLHAASLPASHEKNRAESDAYAVAEVAHALTHGSTVEDLSLIETAKTAVSKLAEQGRSGEHPLLSGGLHFEDRAVRRTLEAMFDALELVVPKPE
jgi:hypothetical protein